MARGDNELAKLSEGRVFSFERIQELRKQSGERNISLFDCMIEDCSISEDECLTALSKLYDAPIHDLSRTSIPEEAVKAVSARTVSYYRFVPVGIHDDALVIALSDPSDLKMQDEISKLIGKPVEVRLASPKAIEKAIKQYYGIGADTIEQIITDREIHIEGGGQDKKESEIADLSVDASITKFVNQLFLDSYRERATDIHFEPFESFFRIRYRIDGLLYEIPIPEHIRRFQQEIVSRIKIMANLNIAETRLPQDGRIKISIGGQDLDLRISILPMTHGESVNVRLLQCSNMFLELEELGLSHDNNVALQRMTKKAHGIILLTGPTGSGKTTTLYALLAKMNRIDHKIITIEDPVEYQLPGVCQMQVKPKIGFTFASGLRSILRHDPDVIMVGEIRDFETAELAIRASLTGHLVFSTVHTNDAPSCVTRLQDIGIDSYLLASSLECIVAQRLVRRICDNCKSLYDPPPEVQTNVLQALGGDVADILLFKGAGCEKCHYSGYWGRTAISELLVVNDPIRSLILEGGAANVIKRKAVEQGMKPLRQDGFEKAIAGQTTVEEVLRVTQEEEL